METNVNDIANSLSAQFPQEMEKTIVKSGVELIYLPISEVINRLNKVIGVDNWSFEIISVQRDLNDIDEVVAHVVLTAKIGENTVVKHGIGGQQIKRSRKDNRVIDLGNDFKGAVSDAQKKAAQQLGIGLYLARSADALDAEEAIETYNAPVVVPQNVLVTEVDERWGAFVEIVSGLSKDQKDDLNGFWNNHAGGRPKPTKATATLEDLEPLIVEALRLRFDGSYTSEAS
jgi:hypothetical protein